MDKPISVIKFGGSSLNSNEKMGKVYNFIRKEIEDGFKIVAVVSAFRGATNLLQEWILDPGSFDISRLYNLHEECLRWLPDGYVESYNSELKGKLSYISDSVEPVSSWLRDDLLAMGETFSTQILSGYLTDRGLKISLKGFYDPDFPTRGGGEFGNARIDLNQTAEACRRGTRDDLMVNDCVIVPGMGCVSDYDGRIRTRRGASDYVASSISYGLKARRLWILSDIHGIMTADSSIIPEAETVPHLTVGELLDAGALGAKNTNTTFFLPLTRHCPEETYFARYDDREGPKTRIVEREAEKLSRAVKLVAGREIQLYTFRGYDIEESVLKLEKHLSSKFDFIRGSGFKRERYFAFFDIDQTDKIERDVNIKEEALEVSSSRMGVVGLVGEGMHTTKRVIERMGKALGDINIVYTLDLSRISVGAVVERNYLKSAIKRLYSDFIAEKSKN